MQTKARLALVHLTSSDPVRAADYYSKMFGIPFSKIPSSHGDTYQAPIGPDGCSAVIGKPYRGDEGVTIYFAIENLRATVKALETEGGRVVHGVEQMPTDGAGGSLGQFCEVIDGSGNRYGLVEYSDSVNAALVNSAHVSVLTDSVASHHGAPLV